MLVGKGVLQGRYVTEVAKLKAFTVLSARGHPQTKAANLHGIITKLHKMAMALAYLVRIAMTPASRPLTNSIDAQLEFSLGMFHNVLVDMGKPAKGKPKGAAAARSDAEIQRMLVDVEKLLNNGQSKATQHPKLDMVKRLVSPHPSGLLYDPAYPSSFQLVNHLAQHQEDGTQTRCMVFCSYRGAVGELVVGQIR